jgi:hypothetical protein
VNHGILKTNCSKFSPCHCWQPVPPDAKDFLVKIFTTQLLATCTTRRMFQGTVSESCFCVNCSRTQTAVSHPHHREWYTRARCRAPCRLAARSGTSPCVLPSETVRLLFSRISQKKKRIVLSLAIVDRPCADKQAWLRGTCRLLEQSFGDG